MTTRQPLWRCLAQLGDADPVTYGGYWVYTDRRGGYPPEGEYLATIEDGPPQWQVHRFILDRCTDVNGVLSDNQYHPEVPAWFAADLDKVAQSCGKVTDDLRAQLCSEDPIARAYAYQDIGEYHGFDNLDGYPRTYSRRADLPRRIRRGTK